MAGEDSLKHKRCEFTEERLFSGEIARFRSVLRIIFACKKQGTRMRARLNALSLRRMYVEGMPAAPVCGRLHAPSAHPKVRVQPAAQVCDHP